MLEQREHDVASANGASMTTAYILMGTAALISGIATLA